MNIVNERLEVLLKKYDLYEKYDDSTVQKSIINILNNTINLEFQYIVLGDAWSMVMLENSKIRIKRFYYVDDTEFFNISQDQFEKYDKILFFSYFLDINEVKRIIPNNNIINLFEYLPEHLQSKGSQTMFNVTKKIELINAYSKCKEFNEFLDEQKEKIEDEYNSQVKTIIWGGGYHTKFLLKNTEVKKKMNVTYIVDSNPTMNDKYIENIKIISKEKLEKLDFNTFIISSLQYWEEIKNEIASKYKNKYIVSPYEQNRDWGSLFNVTLNNDNYVETKDTLLEKIKLFLSIRDFYNAEKNIKTYIQNGYDTNTNMNNFLGELNELLNKIEEDIKSKRKSNIHFMLVDALDKEGSEKYMNYLTEFGKKNVKFDNAFSASTYTTESHLCMFKGKYLFDQGTFIRKNVQINECNFLQELKNREYNLACNDATHIIEELFDFKIGESDVSTPISKILWDNLCYVLNNLQNKNFIYSRFMEHHESYTIFMYKYIDEQLEYYNRFFSDEDIILISADHGCGVSKLSQMYHIPLMIKTQNNLNINLKELFSMKDIGKILMLIIEKKFKYIKKNEYIRIERTPIYNIETKKRLQAMGGGKYIKAFKIIRTLNEEYIIFEDGVEEYYKIYDENINLVENEEYIQRIEYFRKINKINKFPDFKEDKDYYS